MAAESGLKVYISVAAVTATYGSALTAGHFWQTPGMPAQPKVTKRSLPHHSVPRLGSACPHSGPVPRAAATGHPWPGAAKSASLPIYPLHRAYLRPSWLTGPAHQNQKQIKSRAQRPTGRLECLTARSKARANADLLFCGSWLACDADTSVLQIHQGDAIAGKPAPTVDRARFRF